MLTDILITNPDTSSSFHLLGGLVGVETEADKNIQLHEIDGLGPVKADISTSDYANIRGALFTGGHTGLRNIVIKVGLNPDWGSQSMTSLRKLLYGYFMPESPVHLTFSSDEYPDCGIDGYIESMEPDIFSKSPELQISIICPQPDFVAESSTVINGIVGGDSAATAQEIDNPGTIPSGFTVQLGLNTGYTTVAESHIAIQKGPDITPKYFIVTTALVISVSHTLYYNSIPGLKAVKRLNSTGGNDDLLGYVSTTYDEWHQLSPGTNFIKVYGDDSVSGHAKWTLTYFARFGGL